MAQFKKGQSGNPSGKPKGARDKRTELRALFKPDAPTLVKKAIAMALEGDMTALRLCIDRIVPPLRAIEQPVHLDVLSGSLSEQSNQILLAIADGKLSPGEGSSLLGALTSHSKIIETTELIERIEKLEQAAKR
jgi:hypothetical protein